MTKKKEKNNIADWVKY